MAADDRASLTVVVLFWIGMGLLIVASILVWLWWNGPLVCAHFGKLC